MKTCFLFPGQGAQYPGMGKDFWEHSDSVKRLFAIASDVTGMDLEDLLFRGSSADLQVTNRTQIAVTLVNLSAARILLDHGIEADGYAGFSVGEYAALAASGVISEEDLFRIVKARGELMESASRDADTESGQAGMAAVVGITSEEVTRALTMAGSGVYAANFSSPKQVVIAGTFEGLQRAEQLCMEAGARRFIRLRVSGPFHSPLIDSARQKFARVVSGFNFSDPVVPVYANVTGTQLESGVEAQKRCVEQIVSSVQWVREINTLLDAGYKRFLETGPGNVLTGLMRGFSSDIFCKPVGDMDQVRSVIGK